MRIRAIIDRGNLIFEVTDEGPGFDIIASNIDCTTPENVGKEEGRGLFLMQHLMDRVESFRTTATVCG